MMPNASRPEKAPEIEAAEKKADTLELQSTSVVLNYPQETAKLTSTEAFAGDRRRINIALIRGTLHLTLMPVRVNTTD